MDSYNLADAKANFSDLVGRAEAGEEIEIKRRGRPVAKIVPIEKPKKSIDYDALKVLTDRMKPSKISSVEILREMRDSRY